MRSMSWVKGLGRRPWVALIVLIVLGAGLAAACGEARPTDAGPSPAALAEQPIATSSPTSLGVPATQAGVSAPAAFKAQERPNVLLITVDTLRADAVAAYGNPRLSTPNMDSLAGEGAKFTLAVSAMPQTNPTHATIFTGSFPSRHAIFHHMASLLSESVKPLAEILQEVGYTTAGHFSWISFDPQYSGLERGFATWERHTVDRPFPPGKTPDFYEEYLDSKADVTSDGVLSWLEGGASEPFFLWIHYNDAHWPYEPPAPFGSMFTQCQTCMDGSMDSIKRIAEGYAPSPEEAAHLRGLYDGEVAFVDQQLGRVLGWLREKEVLDRTVVVLTADHGEGFGEKGLYSHQEVLYTTATRVPLIIRYPEMVPASVVKAPASSVDILPTLMDILGMDAPEGIHGKSLLPLVLGQEDGKERAVFSQLWDSRKVAVFYQDKELIKDRSTGSVQLYDLEQDLLENNDLAQAQPDMARSLEQRLDAWVLDQGLGP